MKKPTPITLMASPASPAGRFIPTAHRLEAAPTFLYQALDGDSTHVVGVWPRTTLLIADPEGLMASLPRAPFHTEEPLLHRGDDATEVYAATPMLAFKHGDFAVITRASPEFTPIIIKADRLRHPSRIRVAAMHLQVGVLGHLLREVTPRGGGPSKACIGGVVANLFRPPNGAPPIVEVVFWLMLEQPAGEGPTGGHICRFTLGPKGGRWDDATLVPLDLPLLSVAVPGDGLWEGLVALYHDMLVCITTERRAGATS